MHQGAVDHAPPDNGVGTLFYAAVSSVELVVEGTVRGYFERRRVKAAIGRLNSHYILCGYGRVGKRSPASLRLIMCLRVVVEHDGYPGGVPGRRQSRFARRGL